MTNTRTFYGWVNIPKDNEQDDFKKVDEYNSIKYLRKHGEKTKRFLSKYNHNISFNTYNKLSKFSKNKNTSQNVHKKNIWKL